jgi:hypothetical protein
MKIITIVRTAHHRTFFTLRNDKSQFIASQNVSLIYASHFSPIESVVLQLGLFVFHELLEPKICTLI